MKAFGGDHAFLSNFYMSPVLIEGVTYPSAEHAFQAMKTLEPAERGRIRMAFTAGAAKAIGRKVALRPRWDEMRVDVMRRVLASKFAAGTELAARLEATGDETLVEVNDWGDRFWGVCDGVGFNWLGKLLMERREALTWAG